MTLLIPEVFLKRFFEYLYYSILPDCVLWDEKSSIIVEPVCSLMIEDMKIIDCKLIDEWLDTSFDKANIRNWVKDGITHADSTDREQVLVPLIKNVFELSDNRVLYPGKRLSKFVSQVLPNDMTISRSIDGICHFHATTDPNLSEIDYQTMKKLAGVMKKYGKNNIIDLVIAKGNPNEYIEKSRTSKSKFVEFMINDLKNTRFNAKRFYPDRREEDLDISIENS